MRIRPVLAALLVAGLLGAATGCGATTNGNVEPVGAAGPSGAAAGAQTPAGPAASASAGPVAVPKSLEFEAKTLGGQPFEGATLAGKPTVLWFWAPWCATCAGQASSVADLSAQYGDKVGFVGVAGLGEAPAMKDFVKEFSLQKVTQLNDKAGVVWRRFQVVEQSTFVILDRDGRVVHRGWLDSLQFEQKVAALAA
jgi:thiol-disulfide isomerase/thioredoxin